MKDKDQKVLVALGEPLPGQLPTVVFGVPQGAWEYMQGGKTHTFDLSAMGIRAQLVMYGAKDYDDAVRVLQDSAASVSMPTEGLKDLGIKDPSTH